MITSKPQLAAVGDRLGASSAERTVAVIGNMNNNGFSLMRYFRDLGANARLYPFSSDAEGDLTHFGFESDTWFPDRWQNHVELLPFANSARTLYSFPYFFSKRRTIAIIRAIADRGELTIGSGIAPALFAKAGRRLAAFFPYATGVELLGHLPFLAAMERSPTKWLLYSYVRRLQTRGILEAGRCLNAEMSLSKEALDRIGRKFDRLAIPMVYNREKPPISAIPYELMEHARRIRAQTFVVFCHARHLWVRNPSLTAAQFKSFSKNTDWLIRGFADFRDHVAHDAVLCLVEYGPDVEASRNLVSELGIAGNVIWLPKMKRREIMYLLSLVNVGVGEFHTDPGILWGGTGWEVLASGKPLIQCFNFTPESYSTAFGHPPPPILDARSHRDVAHQLGVMYASEEGRERLGRESVDWFERYNGIGLAGQWLSLVQADETDSRCGI